MAYISTVMLSLQWRHNGLDGVSNHQHHHCLLNRLLNRLFRRIQKKTSKLRVTGLCAGNSPVTREYPVQMSSTAENVSIWWRHHIGLVLPEFSDFGIKRSNIRGIYVTSICTRELGHNWLTVTNIVPTCAKTLYKPWLIRGKWFLVYQYLMETTKLSCFVRFPSENDPEFLKKHSYVLY